MSWASGLRNTAYGLGLSVSAPVWGWSLWRTGKWRTDWRGRFGHVGTKLGTELETSRANPKVLVHGVSVGEINLLRGLVAALIEPGCEVIVASTTNTGFARAAQVFGETAGVTGVVRWPLDFSWVVRRFLDAVAPDAVVSAELEVWPNFVEACEERGIHFVVVNGRLSERSFRRYAKVKPLLRRSFARIAAAGVQTEAYAERFVALGTPAERVAVLDTMKWDPAKLEPASEVAGRDTLAAVLGVDVSRPVVVAGSTALGEARLLGDALHTWDKATQLVVAPRKPEWFDASCRELEAAGWDVVRRSHDGRPTTAERPRAFLLDTIGELRAAYAFADVCVVGRSFTGELYGSDPMEPASLRKPTVIGPWHADFADAVSAMHNAGGLIVTKGAHGEDLGTTVEAFLRDKNRANAVATAGVEVIRSRQGATRRHADMVMRVLAERSAADPTDAR